MSKRALIAAAVFALAAAACSNGSEPELSLGVGKRFVPQVVDAVTDVGRSPAIVLDDAGEPTISYLGFNSIPDEGEIPEARTIDMTLVPGVLTADAQGGYWNLTGVVEQSDALLADPEAQQPEPFANASTAAAVDSQGVLHVAWIDSEGVKYAAEASGRFVPETVYAGRDVYGLSMAADDSGRVWISYFDHGTVISSLKLDGDWMIEVIAKVGSCGKDCLIARTATATLGHEPVIAYTDSNGATAAIWDARQWNYESLPGDGGFAVGAATTDDGPLVSYVTSEGEVTVAEYAGSTWKTAPGASIEMAEPPGASLTTGIAQDADGIRYLTWYDPVSDSVKLAVDSGTGFAPVSTPETGGGAMPSIVAAEEGAWIAWYDHVNENLQAGFYGEQEPVLAVASPQIVAPVVPPEPEPGAPAAPSEDPAGPAPEPGSDVKPVTLTIESPAGSVATGFDKTSLSAPADTPILIDFNNSDPGVPHNVEILSGDPAADPAAESLFSGETITGPAEITYDVQPLSAADYFYRCIVHPTTMTGTLKVK